LNSFICKFSLVTCLFGWIIICLVSLVGYLSGLVRLVYLVPLVGWLVGFLVGPNHKSQNQNLTKFKLLLEVEKS
jgi:hypothetical protein